MAAKFKIGQEVMVNTKQISQKKGVIRFLGKIQGKPDEYVGIELDEPCGKNCGDVQGKPYFKIEKKTNKGHLYGVFVRPTSIKPVTQPKKATAPVAGRSSKPAPSPSPPANQGKNKLANELLQQQNNEIHGIKEELQAAYEKIKELSQLDAVKQVQTMRAKMKQLEDINRTLKREIEQVRYRSDANQEQKLKELGQKLNFFQSQKDAAERERSELKKKIERLEAELEEGADRQDMLEKLTFKVESLENKNEQLKSRLESANTQVKNTQMLNGGGRGASELELQLSTLNEMVTLLESDLNQEKDKNAKLKVQLNNNSLKLNDLVKLERKLKRKDEQIQSLKNELETYSDAANFVQKLTLDLISKQEKLRDHTKRLKEYAEQAEKMQNDLIESQEMISLQTQEMDSLQEEVQKHINQKAEQHKHINLLNEQINKYKQKIRELTDNNSSLLMTMEEKQDQSVIRNYFNTDIYQHKYYELSKLCQSNLQSYLDYRLQMSTIRHYAGTYLANLIDTLPDTFSSKLYPHLLNLLLKITAVNNKLYLLFDTTASALTHKSELYAPDQQNLASWLLMLLEQIPILYNSLLKLQFAIISADAEDDVNQILSNHDLKDQITRIDLFCQELLQRITSDTVDIQVEFDSFIEPVEVLDKVCLSVKRLPTELATRLELCSETMRAIQQILSSIELYRRTSEARQAAQVDTMLENFLKLLEGYLRQCCMNPHIRLKSDMKSYLSGIDFIGKILKQVELNDTLQELNSLYSETEDIKMLKETVLNTQYHLKQLSNDLEHITYSTPLSRIHVKLPGKLWQDRLKEMRQELFRFEITLAEKEELERVCSEQKRKILILQKDIKDKQATKQLHQRRIGELQLKVEQAGFVESDFKRQTEKLVCLQQANKLIEEELGAQSKKKKELEDDLRKTKQKFDIFQTQTMMKQKKQKVSNTLSSQDISNLAIFKSVVADASALRNHQAKRKLHELSFSPILNPRPTPSREVNTRREILQNLFEVKIHSNNFTTIQNSLSKAEFKQPPLPPKDYSIGYMYLRNVQSASLTIDLSRNGLVSY